MVNDVWYFFLVRSLVIFLLRRKRRIVCGMCMFVVLALVRHYDNGLIFHVENAASSVTVFFLGTFPPCDLLAYRAALAGGHKGGISTCPSAGKKLFIHNPLHFFFGRFFFGLETVRHKTNLHNPFCRFGIWKNYTSKNGLQGCGL